MSTIPLPTITETSVVPSITPVPMPPQRIFEHVTKLGHIALWIIFAIFVVLTLLFGLMTSRVPKPNRFFHYIAILLSVNAALTYFLMASGQGWAFCIVEFIPHDKNKLTEIVLRQVYWIKYIDWTFGSILQLIGLTCISAHPGSEVILLVYADIAMHVFGLFYSTTHRKMHWAYLVIAAILYVYIFSTILITSRRLAILRHVRVGRFFTAIAFYTAIVWLLYPLTWIAAEGCNKISVNTEIILYGVFDVLSKGLWAGWLLMAHANIEECRSVFTGWWVGYGEEGSTGERRRLLDDD